jgi:hypothetical protein
MSFNSFSISERETAMEKDMFAVNRSKYYEEKDKYESGMWVLYQDGKLLKCDKDKEVLFPLITRGCFLAHTGHENDVTVIPSVFGA